MDSAIFDELRQRVSSKGAPAAVERLCAYLREQKDYSRLFYALLLKKRHELGVSVVPTATVQELPEPVQQAYEDGIREAGRLVGGLFLEAGDIPSAWVYFRMLGEPAPVAAALEKYQPVEGEDVHAVAEIAFHQGVNPRRGFDLILEHFGLCNAITTLGGQEAGLPADVRAYCVRRLVRALYEELRGRLAADIARREGAAPELLGVHRLLEGRDWIFEDEFGHVDVSHLSAVVQMSVHLEGSEELGLARELCAYGRRLMPRLRYAGEPPFEDLYADHAIYLAALAGDAVDEAVAHFRAKVEGVSADEQGTRPAEVLVNLLLRLGRPAEALAVARRHLADADGRYLTCPSIAELCQRAGDYRALADVAREQGDPVHFLAGILEESARR